MDIDKRSIINHIRSHYSSRLIVIYDGECPVCKRVTLYSKLKQAFDSLDLVNAREIKELVCELREVYDLDVNLGMVVLLDQDIYFGGEALEIIGLNSAKDNFKGKLIYSIFKHKLISVQLYPFWKFLRSVLLTILGRSRL